MDTPYTDTTTRAPEVLKLLLVAQLRLHRSHFQGPNVITNKTESSNGKTSSLSLSLMTITRIGKKVLLIGPLLIIRLFCFVAFFYQTYTLINGMINPSETLISMQERNLSEIRFPLIFKICIKPGFNETEVMNLGYSTSWPEAKNLLYLVQFMVLNSFCENTPIILSISQKKKHTSNLSREPREYPCKFFLAGVNFYRFNAKNWQLTV